MAVVMLPTILVTLTDGAVTDADGLGRLVWVLTLIGEVVVCGAVAVTLHKRNS